MRNFSISGGADQQQQQHLLQEELLKIRFWLVVVSGGLFAAFGILANGLLTRLFLSSPNFRHSPFFFLGFVALFDTLVDSVYIFLLIPPVLSEYLQLVRFYLLWLRYVKWLYMLGQIFKLASVFCLIVASFERYLITSHWTFSGFEKRTRLLLLALVLSLAVAIRFGTSIDVVVVLFDARHSDPFRRYKASQLPRREWLPNFLSLMTVIIPFGILMFLNGGIVLMLRQQNVQQLRSLITELTMGYDFMKVRRRNIRSATNTLLVIITAYLVSNLLNLFLSVCAFLMPGFLQQNYPHHYLLSSDCASVLTVIGNALRPPAHFCTNEEVRDQCRRNRLGRWCCGHGKKIPCSSSASSSSSSSTSDPESRSFTSGPKLSVLKLRRYSERLENPWFSAILTARPPQPITSAARRFSRAMGQALLEKKSRKKRAKEQRKMERAMAATNPTKANKGKAELEAFLLNGNAVSGTRKRCCPHSPDAEFQLVTVSHRETIDNNDGGGDTTTATTTTWGVVDPHQQLPQCSTTVTTNATTPIANGRCAVCRGQLTDGGACCSGGALGTDRESLYEELSMEDDEEEEEAVEEEQLHLDDDDGPDVRQKQQMTERIDSRRKRRMQLMRQRRGEHEQQEQQTRKLNAAALFIEDSSANDIRNQLRFDPAEFASLTMAI